MCSPLARCHAATWLCPDDCAGLAGLLRTRLHAYSLCGLTSSTSLKKPLYVLHSQHTLAMTTAPCYAML